MRPVAVLLSCSLLSGCFPHNAQHRLYAQLSEGASIAGGIALLAGAQTGADCDIKMVGMMGRDDCKSQNSMIGNIGLALVIAGLVGFIATASTAEDDKPVVRLDPPLPPPAVKAVEPAPMIQAVEPAPQAVEPPPAPTPVEPTPAPVEPTPAP